MITIGRTWMLAGVAAAAVGLGLGTSDARAQGQVYGGRVYGGQVYAPRVAPYYAPGASYYAPGRGYTYSRGYGGAYAPMRGYNYAGYGTNYGYAPARRGLLNNRPFQRRR